MKERICCLSSILYFLRLDVQLASLLHLGHCLAFSLFGVNFELILAMYKACNACNLCFQGSQKDLDKNMKLTTASWFQYTCTHKFQTKNGQNFFGFFFDFPLFLFVFLFSCLLFVFFVSALSPPFFDPFHFFLFFLFLFGVGRSRIDCRGFGLDLCSPAFPSLSLWLLWLCVSSWLYYILKYQVGTNGGDLWHRTEVLPLPDIYFMVTDLYVCVAATEQELEFPSRLEQ